MLFCCAVPATAMLEVERELVAESGESSIWPASEDLDVAQVFSKKSSAIFVLIIICIFCVVFVNRWAGHDGW